MILGLFLACSTEPLPSKTEEAPKRLDPPEVSDLPDPPQLKPETDGRLSLQLQISDGRQIFLDAESNCFVFKMTADEIAGGREKALLSEGSTATRVAIECPTDMATKPWTLCLEGRILRDANQACACVSFVGKSESIVGCPTQSAGERRLNSTFSDGRVIYRADNGGCYILDLSEEAPVDAKPEDLGPIQSLACPDVMLEEPWSECVNAELVLLASGECACRPNADRAGAGISLKCPAGI